MKSLRLWPLAALFLTAFSGADESIYSMLMESKSCSETASQQRDCKYTIGDKLWVEINAVGTAYATATFMKSDWEKEGYYGTFATSSGCVSVSKKGTFKYAFISPRSGKIYEVWTDCRDDK